MIMILVFTAVSARRSRSDDIEDRLRSVSTNSVFNRDLSYELDDSRLKVHSLSDDNETELEFGLKADDNYLKLEYSVNKSSTGSAFELRFYGMNVSGTMYYLRSNSLSHFGCTNSSAFMRCNAVYHDGLFDFQVDFSGQPFTLNGDLILSTEFKITVTVNASTPCSLVTRFSVNDDNDSDGDDDTDSSATLSSTTSATSATASTTDDESSDDDRLKPDDLYEDSLMLNVSKNIFFSFDDFVTSDDGVSALMVELDDDRMTFHFNVSQFVWDPVVGATSSFTGIVIPSSETTKDRVPGWGVALIVVGGVMILAAVLFLIYQAKNGKIICI